MQTRIIPYSIMRVLVKHVSCVCQNPHTAFCFFLGSILLYHEGSGQTGVIRLPGPSYCLFRFPLSRCCNIIILYYIILYYIISC